MKASILTPLSFGALRRRWRHRRAGVTSRARGTHQEPGGRVIVQIFSNTPAWVFVLFIVLLAFGIMQTRTRSVRRFPALLLPTGRIVLSLAGINSSFGLTPVPLAAWAIALAISAVVGYALFRDRRVEFDTTEQKFFVPGSWMPLVVIMAIFSRSTSTPSCVRSMPT
jgi:hypothetical protein